MGENKKNIFFVAFLIVFGVLLLICTASALAADVSVSISTDKLKYTSGDFVVFTSEFNISGQTSCTISSAALTIHDVHNNTSIECDLPASFGTYEDYGNCNLSVNVSETNHFDCIAYGGNNQYIYKINWIIPHSYAPDNYTGEIKYTLSGLLYINTTIFEITASPVFNGSLIINKQPDTSNVGYSNSEGASVTYYYNITNTGNLDLNITVKDSNCSNILCPKYNLMPGESITCNCTTKLFVSTLNTVNVSAVLPNGSIIYSSDSAYVSVTHFECIRDADCRSYEYCASDHKCHLYPSSSSGSQGVVSPVPVVSPVISPVVSKGGIYLSGIPSTVIPGTEYNGVLKDKDGNPIKNAKIEFILPDGSKKVLFSDATGKFSFEFECGNFTYKTIKNKTTTYYYTTWCGCDKTIYAINITIPEYEPYYGTITSSYGYLHIVGNSTSKTNEMLTYLIKDDRENIVKDVSVNITLPNNTFFLVSDGVFTFNSGTDPGQFTIKAHKDCYFNATFTGNIIPRKLIISCPEKVYVGEKIICNITDENGTLLVNTTVIAQFRDGTNITTTSDENGSISIVSRQNTTIEFTAMKELYGLSRSSTVVVPKEVVAVVCPAECKCGCFEGTSKCKECFDWWWIIILVLVLLLLVLLLFLMKKKKVVSDAVFIESLKENGKINDFLKKYSKIYMLPDDYKRISDLDVDMKKFEAVELNDEGKRNLERLNDDVLALAVQLKTPVITENEKRKEKAKEFDVKIYDESEFR